MSPIAGCAEIAPDGTISAPAPAVGVKLVGRTERRIAPVEGVRVGRRGMRVVKVLEMRERLGVVCRVQLRAYLADWVRGLARTGRARRVRDWRSVAIAIAYAGEVLRLAMVMQC